ncbi:O-antigen ligase family protein [Lactobacillus amylovorus]|uniref:O-antigen ligase family protein n=1 Tax=Lactobacillus amylovorus TaxID=1604 RepID=UPI001CC9CDB5|nr:O-antigen ligase family protein [Lactobacillus amylovorus]
MKEKTRTVLFWFILIQPFLDLYWFYNGKLADVLPFTLPTIIRILAVFVIFCMFFSQKQNWQKLGQEKWLIVYLALLIVYSILHLIYVRHFNSVNPNDYNYSTVSEIFYLIRMVLPLLVIFFTKELEFTREQFRHVIEGISGLFSFTIVISNLFVISLRSYETGFISANIFEWFVNPNIGYSHMASKGFFNFANMVSAVLFMLVPLMLYFMFSRFNWKTITLNVVQALAMIELGTKVALIGLIGGIIAGILLYVFHLYIVKDVKKNGKAIVVALLMEAGTLAIIPFGPAIQRYNYEKYLAQQSDNSLTQAKEELAEGLKKYPSGQKRKEFLTNFIGEHYQDYALNKKFVTKSYPYKYDPEFWLKIMNEPGTSRMQNRHVEKAMLDQVIKTNNNKLDKVFGISYTRETNIFNLERDFTSQVYSLGWVGMLLFIGPYVVIMLYALIKWLMNKRLRTYLISSMLLSIAFMLLAAFLSGNVMDFLTASFILAFVEGGMLGEIKKED